MLLRDRLRVRIAQMGADLDYVRLADEVLAIRNATPALARRLVEQALVIEDRHEAWVRLGDRIVAAAPERAGVYVLKDAHGQPLYVGKAINIRRRLRTHFASRRWKTLKADFSRAETVMWREVGSELEALLLESRWIRELAPTVNVQRGEPSVTSRVPRRVVRDVVVLVPSVEAEAVELVGARVSGLTVIERTPRDGSRVAEHADRLWTFFAADPTRIGDAPERSLAPIVYSWLAGRGSKATRIDMSDLASSDDLRVRLSAALRSPELFEQRIVLRNSHRSA